MEEGDEIPTGLERTLASSAGVALAEAEVNTRNLGGPIRLRGVAANYNLAAIATLVKELGVPSPVEIVPKPKGVKSFTVLSRRWVVDPKSPYQEAFVWLGRWRRPAKDFE